MSAVFKSSIMGFNKQDVVEYIEKIVRERDALMEEKESRIKTLEKELRDQGQYREQSLELVDMAEQLISENKSLYAEKDRLLSEISRAEEARTVLEERIAELKRSLDETCDNIDVLGRRMAETEQENATLKNHNVRLLRLTEKAARDGHLTVDEAAETLEMPVTPVEGDFGYFKTKLTEITAELAVLARSIEEAEKRSIRDSVAPADTSDADVGDN